MFEANLSLATLCDKMQGLKFGENETLSKINFLKTETEELLAKMDSSYKDSFSQVPSINMLIDL